MAKVRKIVKPKKKAAKKKHVAKPSKFSIIEGETSWKKGQVTIDRAIRHPRNPIVLTTNYWIRKGLYISLWVNPSQTQWSLGRRETVTKTAAGIVRNTWRNRYRNTYYDEFTVNFNFQAGNIMPSAGVPDTAYADPSRLDNFRSQPIPPPGLENLYAFMSMIDQPMLMGQYENRHVIIYRSRLFPSLRMSGYWLGTTPVAFTDDSTRGNTVTWTATFQCYNTSPPLWSWKSNRLSPAWSDFYAKHGEEIIDQDTLDAIRANTQQYAAIYGSGFEDEASDTLPPPPTDPDQAPPKSSSKVLVGKRANTGVKRIGLVTGDMQSGVGSNPARLSTNETALNSLKFADKGITESPPVVGAGKTVVKPSNTPVQRPITDDTLSGLETPAKSETSTKKL